MVDTYPSRNRYQEYARVHARRVGRRFYSRSRRTRLVILNRIQKYATLLARQCDARAALGIDLDELLPWETSS